MCLVIAGGNIKEVSGYNISEQEPKKNETNINNLIAEFQKANWQLAG